MPDRRAEEELREAGEVAGIEEVEFDPVIGDPCVDEVAEGETPVPGMEGTMLTVIFIVVAWVLVNVMSELEDSAQVELVELLTPE